MTSLTKLIKYRKYASELYDDEFSQFITIWTKKYGRNILLTPFFNQFTSTNTTTTPIESIDKAIEIMKTIIQSRDNNSSEESSIIDINFLSSSLTQQIASYLNHKDYIQMSKCNRSLFIHLNTTCTLTELNLTNFNSYENINLCKYPKLQHLKFKLSKFDQLQLPQYTICNYLNKLTIDAEDITHNSPQLTNFLQATNIINTENIIQLNMESFGSWDNQFTQELRLIDIFKQFPKLERLSVDNCHLLMSNTLNPKELLPNLIGFKWNGGNVNIANLFINVFGNQLLFLSLAHHENIIVPENIQFINLYELQMESPSKDFLNKFLLSAINLKKIEIDQEWFMRDNELKEILQKIISEYKQLEYLGIDEWQNERFDTVCNGIERGLFKIINHKNGNLKIKIIFNSSLSMNPESSDMLINLSRLICQLNSGKLLNWMVICEFNGKTKENQDDAINYNRFIGIVDKNNAKIALFTPKKIVITNKECNICGFNESWIMK
eukprot:463646_1